MKAINNYISYFHTIETGAFMIDNNHMFRTIWIPPVNQATILFRFENNGQANVSPKSPMKCAELNLQSLSEYTDTSFYTPLNPGIYNFSLLFRIIPNRTL